MRLRKLYFALFTFLALPGYSQLLYNNGADVAVTGGGVMYVDGAVENAAGGLFSNAGQTTVKGFFRNGSLATGGGTNGEYIVHGDWENNQTFTADQSMVRLRGNAQLITGSSVTTFYDLSLEGGNSVKTQTLDAFTSHKLDFNNAELATGPNLMTVTNPSFASVTRQGGFVSSTGAGRFVRYTNSTNSYLFPTGWNDNGTIWYRPVDMAPTVADAQSFAVRMGFGDATAEGYDISQKAGNVTAVNNKFFHLIKQYGSVEPADLSIYYFPQQDSLWNSIGRWQIVPEWQDLTNVTVTNSGTMFRNTRKLWADNGQEPHVLINAKEITNLYNFPNVFSPNEDGTNDLFGIINQLGLVELEDLKVFNRWGEPVFDSQRDGAKDWNGFYQGKLQPMGNYVYMASVKVLATGAIQSAKGNLSLLW